MQSQKNNSLGQRLKLLRGEQGLTQQQLAQRLGLSRGIIGNYEIDAREPDYRTLALFADYFGVSLDFLLGRTQVRYSLAVQQQLEGYQRIVQLLNRQPKALLDALERLLEHGELVKRLNGLSPQSRQDLLRYTELLQLRDTTTLPGQRRAQ